MGEEGGKIYTLGESSKVRPKFLEGAEHTVLMAKISKELSHQIFDSTPDRDHCKNSGVYLMSKAGY